MDFAYDQIQEESLPADREGQPSTSQPPTDLNTEFQQAFKAVSASPWGARLGGFFAQAKKQGESLYSDAQKEYANRSEQAAKVAGELQKSLVESTRNISLAPDAGAANTSFSDPNFALPEGVATETKGKEKEVQSTEAAQATRPDSLPADIVKEATSLVSLLRSKAATATANLNLQKIQAAEDAADEALLKFGTGIRSFLRDAVTVTAPSSSSSTEVLFETNDAEGKRVIHSSRFDAQLHVIHTSPQTFTTDPDSAEYTEFAKEFDIAAKTDGIAADLEKYPELRRAMEKLVPEKVEYTVFWTRYYFLRKVIQEEEVRRREVLKGAAQSTNEDLTWDSDSDSDADNEDDSKTATPTKEKTTTTTEASSTPVKFSAPTTSTPPNATQPQHEEDIKSVSSTSDTSYDIVSGTTSRATGSPKDEKSEKAASAAPTKIEEESDEEDWE
ncbi:BSD-domain-containing protein [Aureobasidium sp. EXF-12298]|nr:BSD-domain-containing protein [Aureobasidium sp. EXF-12298]